MINHSRRVLVYCAVMGVFVARGPCALQVEAANESTRVAETRLAEAREESSRLQQRLMAAEEAAGRDARKLETLARDVRAEQQHAEATLERLERAHARVQQLEGQARCCAAACMHALVPCCDHSRYLAWESVCAHAWVR